MTVGGLTQKNRGLDRLPPDTRFYSNTGELSSQKKKDAVAVVRQAMRTVRTRMSKLQKVSWLVRFHNTIHEAFRGIGAALDILTPFDALWQSRDLRRIYMRSVKE